MPPQGLLLIAAYMPESWPVRFVDENIEPATRRRSRLGRRRVRHRHAHPGASRSATFSAARARGRQGDGAGRAVGLGLARDVSGLSTICTSARWATRPTRSSARSTRASRARPRRWCCNTKRAAAAHATSRSPPMTSLPFGRYLLGTMQFSSGCPYTVRVLRHPGPLRPPAAHEDAGADRRRARLHLRAAEPARRRSTSSTTISSATARPRRRCCRISSNGRSATTIR